MLEDLKPSLKNSIAISIHNMSSKVYIFIVYLCIQKNIDQSVRRRLAKSSITYRYSYNITYCLHMRIRISSYLRSRLQLLQHIPCKVFREKLSSNIKLVIHELDQHLTSSKRKGEVYFEHLDPNCRLYASFTHTIDVQWAITFGRAHYPCMKQVFFFSQVSSHLVV